MSCRSTWMTPSSTIWILASICCKILRHCTTSDSFLVAKKLKHQPCITLALSRPFIVLRPFPESWQFLRNSLSPTLSPRGCPCLALFLHVFFSGSSRRRERLTSKRFHSKTGSPSKQCRTISRLSVTPNRLGLLWIRLVGDTLYLICLFEFPWIWEGVKRG